MRRRRDEDGFLGGLDALAFGALVLVTGTLLIINAWSVVDTRMAVSAAAREAVRTIADAPVAQLNEREEHDDLEGTARARALDALVQHGKDVAGLTDGDIVFAPLTDEPRCDWIEVSVTLRAPAIALPFVGVFRDGIPVTVQHRELIDPYRAGLTGEADCV